MESFEGTKAEIRNTISKHLEECEHRLTGELTGKLAERKWIHV